MIVLSAKDWLRRLISKSLTNLIQSDIVSTPVQGSTEPKHVNHPFWALVFHWSISMFQFRQNNIPQWNFVKSSCYENGEQWGLNDIITRVLWKRNANLTLKIHI